MDLIEWSSLVERELHRPPLIRANGKAPLDTGWPTGPFDDPDGWRQRLQGHRSNVGMVCGRGLLVVDGDIYKPGCALDALLDDMGLARHTVTALTGGGGQHLLYTYDPTLSVPSIPLGPLGYPGVELKADGGQVIVEPSVHPDTGRSYRWEIGYGPGDIQPTPATTALLELVGAIPAPGRRRHARWQPLTGGDDLDEVNVDAARLLCDHFGGHDPVRTSGGEIGVFRPGKITGAASATIGYIGPGVVKVWSDGWPPFEQNGVYDVGRLRSMAGVAPAIHVPDALVFPDGYRLWREGDDVVPAPVLGGAVYHGVVGEYLRLVEGHTEAHPAAVGAHILACLGTLMGRSVMYTAGDITHWPNLFVAVVGPSSTAAKGVAEDCALVLVKAISPGFDRHLLAGLGSGEAIVWATRDTDPDDEKAKPTEKRRVVLDSEMSHVLRVGRRDGSILFDILRKAFDGKPLANTTRSGGEIVASEAHISVLGSITPEELRELTSQTAIVNGWGNRYLHIWSEAVGTFPFGGSADREAVVALATRYHKAWATVQERPAINGTRLFKVAAGDAAARWTEFYTARRWGFGDTDVLQKLTARQVPHAARIALIYAVCDGARSVGLAHIEAAVAWCDYSAETAKKVFADGVGGKAGQLLMAIREAGPEGLDGVGQDRVFSGNVHVADLRAGLEERRLIVTYKVGTGGRPRSISVAIAPTDKRING